MYARQNFNFIVASIKILYLFRRPVQQQMKLARIGQIPHDYFFGYTQLSKKFQKKVSDRIFALKILWAVELYLIRAIYPFTRVGFSFISVLRHLGDIQKADVVFATADTYGLPLGFLKQLGVVKNSVVLYTGGLCDAMVESKSDLYRMFCRASLKNISTVISGVQNECQKMTQILKLPPEKFRFVPYGIDTNYFKPKPSTNHEDYILTIGADFKRDWDLFQKVAKSLPVVKFLIITAPQSIKIDMPKNVEIIYNQPIGKVREYIKNCLLVLILSKQNYRFAGQSTIFRAMACAKPVIFTQSHGVEDYPGLLNYKNCIMVPPNDLKPTVEAIRYLLKDKNRAKLMGDKAREFILKYASYNNYTKQLEKIFTTAYRIK